MRVYKYINQEYGLKSLVNKTLKVSRFGELNDPFELTALRLSKKKDRQSLKKSIEKYASEKGTICFSSELDNVLMWSHYADGHRGMVLGFEVPDEFLTKIKYHPERSCISLRNASFENLVKYKSKHWEYEHEVRKIVDIADCAEDGKIHIIKFSEKMKLCAIYLGHSYVTQKKWRLQKSLEDMDVKICTLRLAFQSFRIVNQLSDEFSKNL